MCAASLSQSTGHLHMCTCLTAPTKWSQIKYWELFCLDINVKIQWKRRSTGTSCPQKLKNPAAGATQNVAGWAGVTLSKFESSCKQGFTKIIPEALISLNYSENLQALEVWANFYQYFGCSKQAPRNQTNCADGLGMTNRCKLWTSSFEQFNSYLIPQK